MSLACLAIATNSENEFGLFIFDHSNLFDTPTQQREHIDAYSVQYKLVSHLGHSSQSGVDQSTEGVAFLSGQVRLHQPVHVVEVHAGIEDSLLFVDDLTEWFP